MDSFVASVIALAICIIMLLGATIYFVQNYNYRWLQQCAAANGVQMHSALGDRLCVRTPVQIITIAARPW